MGFVIFSEPNTAIFEEVKSSPRNDHAGRNSRIYTTDDRYPIDT